MERKLVPLGLVIAALLLAYGAPSLPLWDPDEARFARTSLEMWRSGDLVVPTFGGEPRLVKPPLLHWLHTALFTLLDPHVWVVRLPALLASLAMLTITAQAARRRFGEPAAGWALILLGTMPLFYAVGRQATLDSLLMLHVGALVLYDFMQDDDERHPAIYGLLAGIAFLIKGPIGWILPLVMVLAGRTLGGRRVAPTLRGVGITVAATAAVVLPWGLAFLSRIGVGGVGELLREQLFARAVEGTDHVEPVYYYLPVLIVATMPWGFALASGLLRSLRGVLEGEGRHARYLSGALLAGLVLFSLSQGKSPNYLMPLLPIAALLLAWELARQAEAARSRLGATLGLTVMLSLLAIVVALGSARPDWSEFQRPAQLAAAALALGAVVTLVATLRAQTRLAWGAAALAQSLFLAVVVVAVPPRLAETRSSAPFVRSLPELHQAQAVVLVDTELPSLLWYLDRRPERLPISRFDPDQARRQGVYFLFDRRDWERVPSETQAFFEIRGSRGKYLAVVGRPG